MAALTDAMKWYNLGGLKAARTKYHFKVEFFSSKYVEKLGGANAPARLIFDCVRTVELPKYSIETEVANAYNVRQLIPTKIIFEPISVSFNDTLDNRFQKFIATYMSIISGSLAEQTRSVRKEFDNFGLKLLDTDADCPIDRIEITRFYGATTGGLGNIDNSTLENKSKVTLWRPKIVDVQHDTLDYSASEAVTWQLSFRYESVTYEEDSTPAPGAENRETPTTTTETTPTPTPSAPAMGEYTIQPGDQLGFIAQSNGSKVRDLLNVNKHIDFTKPLKPGQVINLPTTSGPGAGSIWQKYPGGVFGDKNIP